MRVYPLIAAASLLCLTAATAFSAGIEQTPGVIPVGIENPPPSDPPPYTRLPYSGKRDVSVMVQVQPRNPHPRPSDHVHVRAYLLGPDGKETEFADAQAGDITYYRGSTSPEYIPAGFYTKVVTFTTDKPGVIIIRAEGLSADNQWVKRERRY